VDIVITGNAFASMAGKAASANLKLAKITAMGMDYVMNSEFVNAKKDFLVPTVKIEIYITGKLWMDM